MKKLFICFLLLGVIVVNLHAQEGKTKKEIGKFGISFSSLGGDEFLTFASVSGGASYDSKGFFAFGVNYGRDINKWLEFETGLEYSKHKFVVRPMFPDAERSKAHTDLLNIPLTVRANFWKYFFANGGLLIDIDLAKKSDLDRQTGVGVMLGVGAKYDFSSGVSVFVNPYVKMHSLLYLTMESSHERLSNAGVRVGVMYNFY